MCGLSDHHEMFLLDPYAWGDNYPSCHPLLESHHSPINLNHQLMKNDSLDSLNLEGFNLTHKGQWRLVNQGYSGESRTDHVSSLGVFGDVLWMNVFGYSCAGGWERDAGERRRSSRNLPHRPAAFPLGKRLHQWIGTHSGPHEVPHGGLCIHDPRISVSGFMKEEK